MAKTEKKHHYVYLIVFTETGEWYIGVHSCDRLGPDGFDPRYFAGGAALKGRRKDLFERTIISRHRSRQAADRREEKEIGDSYETDPLCLNRMAGGKGGVGSHCSESRQKSRESLLRYYAENPEAAEEISKRVKKYFQDPDNLKNHIERRKQYFRENPQAAAEQGERARLHYVNNPESRIKAKERNDKRFSDPSSRETIRKSLKKYHMENPEESKNKSERMKTYIRENPEARKKRDKAASDHYVKNPEAREKARERTIEQFKDPAAFKKNREARAQAEIRRKEMGLSPPNGKQVIAEGMPFLSQSDAGKYIGVNGFTIRERINRGVCGYRDITYEEYRNLAGYNHQSEGGDSA